jgi:hypothetical protein
MRELYFIGLVVLFSIISPSSPGIQPNTLRQSVHPSSSVPPTTQTEPSEQKSAFLSLSNLSLTKNEQKENQERKGYEIKSWLLLLFTLFFIIEFYLLINID